MTLILDDYHVIEAEPVHRSIAFLLDHLPPQLHVVIATRSDPPLPLARLRGRGELAELRAADLRFALDEAAAFLNEVMGLGLAAADVAALEWRTEGWIAGLQLAALSMRGREDVPGFVRAFAGDDRYIVDYLVEEVLRRQPRHIRSRWHPHGVPAARARRVPLRVGLIVWFVWLGIGMLRTSPGRESRQVAGVA